MQQEARLLLEQLESVISGKTEVITRLLTAFLAQGHILLDDAPGVGKTTLASAIGRATGLTCRRVQFTPDVLPSDLVGFSVYDRESGSLRYQPGALLGVNLLLGDELNRAPSRVQSALLQAMEENAVTVDGVTRPLADPFMVIATQNSLGTVGTQPLPYAQLDRFTVRLTIGYPDHAAQLALLKARQGREPLDNVSRVLTAEQVRAMQRSVAEVRSGDSVLDYIARLAVASRELPALEAGISPRGALALDRMAKAHAWLDERDYVTGLDVQAVWADVCLYRVVLSDRARRDGQTAGDVLTALLRQVPTCDRRP